MEEIKFNLWPVSINLYSLAEKIADDLRMAVKEVMCDSDKERQLYEEAVIAVTVDESLKRYQ